MSITETTTIKAWVETVRHIGVFYAGDWPPGSIGVWPACKPRRPDANVWGANGEANIDPRATVTCPACLAGDRPAAHKTPGQEDSS